MHSAAKSFIFALTLPWLFQGSIPAFAEGIDGRIESGELFHDQGPVFCSLMEPAAQQPVELRFRALKNDLSSVSLEYFDEADKQNHSVPMIKYQAGETTYGAGSRYDYWHATLPAGKSRKLYRFHVHDGKADCWYKATGVSDTDRMGSDFMVIPDFKTPAWLSDGVMYQVFPDRFFDSNPGNNVKSGQYSYAGQATIQKAWGESPIPKSGENTALIFYGGDLDGIRQKLDYVRKDLGANIVYLNPVFEAPSNHKYDTTDYHHVARCLGSDESLSRLVSALHETVDGRRGYLVLDAVFNHTGDAHKWFGRYDYGADEGEKGAYESKSSPYFSYYSFSEWPKKYATFLNVDSLPKLNYGSSAVKDLMYLKPDSVAQRYIKAPFGIDAWRVDAPQYVDKDGKQGFDAFNHSIWQEFRKTVKATNPQLAILGEFWQNANAWTNNGKEWDTVTNFDGFTQPVAQWVTGFDYDGKRASLTASQFDRWLRHTRANYPANVQQSLSNHLSNHDISRFAERAAGDSAKISLAFLFQMTYPGTPTIYYGDEYGMQGGKDPDCRRCFDWSKVERKSPLIDYVHQLIVMRNKFAALRHGSFISMDTDDKNNTYVFGRMDKSNRLAVALNAGAKPASTTLSMYKLEIPDGAVVYDALSNKRYDVQNGRIELQLQPYSGQVLVY